jgi:hypothetical protein
MLVKAGRVKKELFSLVSVYMKLRKLHESSETWEGRPLLRTVFRCDVSPQTYDVMSI